MEYQTEMKSESILGIMITIPILLTSLAFASHEQFTINSEWLEIGFASYNSKCIDIKTTDNMGGGSCVSSIAHGYAHVKDGYVLFDDGHKTKLDDFKNTIDSYSIINCFDSQIHCMSQQWRDFHK